MNCVAEVPFRKIATVQVNEEALALLPVFAKDEVGLSIDDESRLASSRRTRPVKAAIRQNGEFFASKPARTAGSAFP